MRLLPQQRHERGSGTVLAIGIICLTLVLTIGGMALVSAVVASHRARAAADLGALTAAARLMRGESVMSACAAAARVVSANAGRLAACRPQGPDTVEILVTVRPGIAVGADAVARSRAGPSPPGS